ncbi:hypothetical protein ACN9U1_03070 [Staphylococcus caprae]|uniref:hypothetical protein n=1 Tax=Staphylococcus caprae TaxID=29380 RepID=UPI003B21D6D3
MGVNAKYEYVVYKGDEILSAGTANEIIEKMGITETHKRAYEADKSNRRTIVAIKVPIAELED